MSNIVLLGIVVVLCLLTLYFSRRPDRRECPEPPRQADDGRTMIIVVDQSGTVLETYTLAEYQNLPMTLKMPEDTNAN